MFPSKSLFSVFSRIDGNAFVGFMNWHFDSRFKIQRICSICQMCKNASMLNFWQKVHIHWFHGFFFCKKEWDLEISTMERIYITYSRTNYQTSLSQYGFSDLSDGKLLNFHYVLTWYDSLCQLPRNTEKLCPESYFLFDWSISSLQLAWPFTTPQCCLC